MSSRAPSLQPAQGGRRHRLEVFGADRVQATVACHRSPDHDFASVRREPPCRTKCLRAEVNVRTSSMTRDNM